MKTAIFPGSFDPFTVGHAHIVERALPLFDRLVIAVGVNEHKRSFYPPEQRVQFIADLYTHDLVRREGAQFIVRGLRSVKDFEYERDIASMNRRLSGVETVLLFTDAHYADISSSVVRELLSYGKDVSEFLPKKP